MIRIRAVQSFTPSQAVGFVFELKEIVKNILEPMPDGNEVPLNQTIEGGMQLRVTPTGFQKISAIIPGILEDMTDIVLNVKSLVVKNHGDMTKVITVEKSEAGPITGADVQTELSNAVQASNRLIDSYNSRN